jgi:hypothetical protein
MDLMAFRRISFQQVTVAVNFQDDQSRDETHLCFRHPLPLTSSHVIHRQWFTKQTFLVRYPFLFIRYDRPGAGGGIRA